MGVSVCAQQLKDIAMGIPYWRTRTSPQGCTIVSLDCFPLVSHPLSSPINSCWICHWNSGKVMKAIFCHQRNRRHKLVPRSSTGLCSISWMALFHSFFYDWVVFHCVNIPLLFLSICLSMDIYIATMWAIRKPMLGKHQWSKIQLSLQCASSVVLLNWGVQQSNKRVQSSGFLGDSLQGNKLSLQLESKLWIG